MKFRSTLVLMIVLAGMFFGFGANQAHAAVQLSATDRSNMQAILDLTQVALDAVQVQINNHTIKDPASMIVTLGGIKSYLLTMRDMLGGPVATAPVAPKPPVVTQPIASQPEAPAAPVISAPGLAPVAADATTQNSQTASLLSKVNLKWAFWVVLFLVIALAIVLLLPRKEDALPLPEAPEPQPVARVTQTTTVVEMQKPEEPQTIQSA